MNVDAESRTGDGKWGLLDVIRDSDGVVMVTACWFHPILHDSDTAEGLPMSLGLNFAKDIFFLNLEVESDLANVIEALKDNKVRHNYFGSLVNECKQTSSHFNHVVFYHIRREANQAAHVLGKLEIDISSNFI